MAKRSEEDAQFAVNLGSKTSLMSIDNHFNNNYISINAVSSLPNNVSMSIGLSISGTTFESTRNLSHNFATQYPVALTRPLAGINLSNVTNVDITPTDINHFNNMNMGIIANRTTLNLSGCRFEGIVKLDPYSGIANVVGSAVYARGSFGSPYSLTFMGRNDSLLPDVENSITGIKSIRMNLIAGNSYMKNVDVGIEAARTIFAKILVKANTIHCNLTGISLLKNSYAKELTVVNNAIKGGENVLQNSGSLANTIGIDLQGNEYWNNARILVANNTIDLFNHGNTGIHLNSSKFADITENNIYLENASINTTMNGIAIENSEQSSISCNTIMGARSVQANDYNEAAIRYASSVGNVISQNVMSRTAQGIEVIGVCTNGINLTTIEKNMINVHYNGLKYHGNAVANQQEHTGNIWAPWFNYSGYGAKNWNALDAFYHQYKVKGGSGSLPSSWDPFRWFAPDGLSDSTINFADCNHYGTVNPNPIPDLLTLADDSIKTIEYQQELNWQTKLQVYQKLIEHPEYLTENADLADFYMLNAATAIHYIAQLNLEKDKLLTEQQTVIENIKKWGSRRLFKKGWLRFHANYR